MSRYGYDPDAARRILSRSGDTTRYFGQQYGVSGKSETFRGMSQNLAPAMRRQELLRHARDQSPKSDWEHLGSIPTAVLVDWLNKNKYTMHQFATNADNCKDKFIKYFLSRDFAKLHNAHVTTKRTN